MKNNASKQNDPSMLNNFIRFLSLIVFLLLAGGLFGFFMASSRYVQYLLLSGLMPL